MILNSPYITGSLTVTGNITAQGGIAISGSIASASFASTASYANLAQTASYVTTAQTASYVALAQTASSISGLNQNVQITGSLTTTGQIVAQTLNVQQVTSSIVYSSGSNIFGNQLTNRQQFTGSLQVTSSNASYFLGGNVGIGTSSPNGLLSINAAASNTPNIRFQNNITSGLDSAISNYSSAGQTFLSVGTNYYMNSGGAAAKFDPTYEGSALLFDGGNFYFYNSAANGASSTKMTITTAGNVGIRTTPASNWYSGNNSAALELSSAGNGLWCYGATTNITTYLLNNAYYTSGFVYGQSSGGASFYRQNNSEHTWGNAGSGTAGTTVTFTDRMKITSAGNVCIGMSSSDYGLVAIKSNGTTAYYGLNIYATGNGNFTYVNHDNSVGIIGTEFNSSGTGHTPLTFQVGGLERLRIGTYGDIGAMTAVTGQGSSQGSYRNFYWGAGIIMGRDAYDSYLCGNIYYDGSWRLKYGGYYGNVVNWYGGEYSFQTSTSNGSANSAVSLLATVFIDRNGNAIFRGSVTQNGSPSDINLKENLVKITSPLEKISQINGYNFDWKEGTPANGKAIPVAEGMQAPESPLTVIHDAGLIAQEVEEIMPELVRESGHKSLNYNGIVALLVEGIKELKAENDTLKDRITALENK